jgi:hypothetical protein
VIIALLIAMALSLWFGFYRIFSGCAALAFGGYLHFEAGVDKVYSSVAMLVLFVLLVAVLTRLGESK